MAAAPSSTSRNATGPRASAPFWHTVNRSLQALGRASVVGFSSMQGDLELASRLRDLDRRLPFEEAHIRRVALDLLRMIPFLTVLALPGSVILVPVLARSVPWLFPASLMGPVSALLGAKLPVTEPSPLLDSLAGDAAKLRRSLPDALRNLPSQSTNTAVVLASGDAGAAVLRRACDAAAVAYDGEVPFPPTEPSREVAWLDVLEGEDYLLEMHGLENLTDREIKAAVARRGVLAGVDADPKRALALWLQLTRVGPDDAEEELFVSRSSSSAKAKAASDSTAKPEDPVDEEVRPWDDRLLQAWRVDAQAAKRRAGRGLPPAAAVLLLASRGRTLER